MGRRSPLHEEHVRRGARLVPFGGWDMPLSYEGVVAEHLAVRGSVGLFDVSHLGKIRVTGEEGPEILDRMLPGAVADLEAGRAGYNLVLAPNGGIVDDIFLYRSADNVLVVPNAANFDAVLTILQEAAGPGMDVIDERERWAIMALSGPKARATAEALLPPEVLDLKLHRFADVDIEGKRARVARTGYTGEFTFEMFVPWDDAGWLFGRLMEAGEPHGIRPAGLGARDTLRLEMGYPLHGHEISIETNPLEAGLEWVIRWEKEFTAKRALEKVRDAGVTRRLVGFTTSDRLIPRAGYPIMKEGEKVGEVTSGNYSPSLARGIALGYVPPSLALAGTRLTIDVRGRELPVVVTKPPFIK